MTESRPAGGAPTPFHSGELAQQQAAGVAQRAARLGPMLRDHLSEQQRAFFPLLPFIVVGSLGPDGHPNASLVAAPPGFVWSPTPGTLRVDALPLVDDPLDESLQPGAALGLLGIQPHTRRRNRVNGRVSERDGSGVTIAVDQAFGNCPKYIHPRELVHGERERGPVKTFGPLDAALRSRLATADTFFIATAHPEASAASAARCHGVDVSHRGGPPGFVFFTGPDSFIVPDYRGNDIFNTLGNLLLDARAGLLFLDPSSGDVLQVSATATTRSGAHPLEGPEASGRVVAFQVVGARLFPGAAPLRVA